MEVGVRKSTVCGLIKRQGGVVYVSRRLSELFVKSIILFSPGAISSSLYLVCAVLSVVEVTTVVSRDKKKKQLEWRRQKII